MRRLTQLDAVLFPVEERPVFTGGNGEPLLSVPDKKAIVDTKRRRVVGVSSINPIQVLLDFR
jgi:hypothetical protein